MVTMEELDAQVRHLEGELAKRKMDVERSEGALEVLKGMQAQAKNRAALQKLAEEAAKEEVKNQIGPDESQAVS